MDQQEANVTSDPSVAVADEPAKDEAPTDMKLEDSKQLESEAVTVSEVTEKVKEETPLEEAAKPDTTSSEKAVEVNQNGSPPQGTPEEEENSTEDDVVKVKAVEKQPEPKPVIETSASTVKEQKKSNKRESKSKSKSRDSGKAKDKKKEDKSIEHVLKALSSLSAPEEKLAALCKKYTELLEEHKTVQAGSKQSQKQATVLMREKEQLQVEHSKALLAKSKMESLCRELQKHNKIIKEESLARVKDEEEKRREVANRFQTTITDIQAQMQDNYSKNTKLREENIELATRLKDLVGNYEKAQTQVEKVFNHNLVLTQEKERDCKEKQLLFLELEQSRKKIEILEMTEQQLRTQLALYTEKYEDFQSTLQKSNDVFTTFKGEMDKMSKKIKKLEKETVVWKSRCENSNKVCLEMAADKQKRDQEIVKLNSKNQKLEKLCRALQVERNTLKSDSDRGSLSRGSSPSDVVKDTSPAPENGGEEKGEAKPTIELKKGSAATEGAEQTVSNETIESTAEQTKNEQSIAKTDKTESGAEGTVKTSNEKPESSATVNGENDTETGNGSDSVSTSATSSTTPDSSGDKVVTSSDSSVSCSDNAVTSSDSTVSCSDSVATSGDGTVTSSESGTSVVTSEGHEDGEGTVSDVD